MTPLRAAACGLAAAALGTLGMDVLWYVRYKRGGGPSSFLAWECSQGLSSWEDASAPAKVGKLLWESATRQELPASRAALTTNIMHWAYGTQWGALLGVAIGSPRLLRPVQAPLLGALVWLASYVVLPIAGVYKPIWQYDPKTLWDDLSAHLVYGVVTAAAFWRMCAS